MTRELKWYATKYQLNTKEFSNEGTEEQKNEAYRKQIAKWQKEVLPYQ